MNTPCKTPGTVAFSYTKKLFWIQTDFPKNLPLIITNGLTAQTIEIKSTVAKLCSVYRLCSDDQFLLLSSKQESRRGHIAPPPYLSKWASSPEANTVEQNYALKQRKRKNSSQ